MRLAFFGSPGLYSARHLDAVVQTHHVVGVFLAHTRPGLLGRATRALRSGGLVGDPCSAVAARHGVPRWFIRRNDVRTLERATHLAPDAICVAGYPWLLPEPLVKTARLGSINSHQSLLPRHRGLLPLFWIYYHGDRETGVTVHRLVAEADAGPIVSQATYSLSRGLPVDSLNARNAELGGSLMLEALARLEVDGTNDIEQDHARATLAPPLVPGQPMIDPRWDVERTWHFLAGLYPRYVEPLKDSAGRRVDYRRVIGYERVAHEHPYGTVAGAGDRWHLFCDGGLVILGTARSQDRGR